MTTEQALAAHFTHVHKLARVLTRSDADADDLAQTAMLRALLGRHRLREGADLRAWLRTIVRNEFYRAGARRTRWAAVADEYAAQLPGPELPTPEVNLDAQAVAEEVRQALGRIQPLYAQAVELADFEGLSYREIAELLGVPIGTVMSRIHRGRVALRAQLEASDESEGPVQLELLEVAG